MKKFKCFVLFLVCFGLTFTIFGANKSRLISNSANDTVVTFTLDSYDFERVQTPQGEAVIVKAPHAGRIMEAGAPDLAKFSAAVIIPDRGKMGIEVIDGQYTELENVKIAPSKGNLLRSQDPNLVPYVYGKEYKKDAFFPGTLAELNKPYIARDFRGQAALIYPFQYNPVTGALRVYSSITVRVYNKGNAGENEFNRDKPLKLDDVVQEFKSVYSRHFINFDAIAQSEVSLQYTPLNDPMGRMLIVCYSGYMSNMSSFVTYKQSIGYTVDLVDYSTIGSAAALKTYVANYYNTNGLTYLLLVGDNAQIPVSSTTAGDSDSNYGFIVGSDHYLDIFVGRFSAESTANVDTQVSRTIYYERDLASSATWFRQATGMASNEGPGHNSEYDATHMNNILSDLSGYGYTTSTNYQDGGSAANLSSLVNAGKGTLWYCGHGNIDGWYCGWTFLNAQVAALTNDNKLPAIFSVACQVGNFKSNTCFCEYWMRETNGSNPAGAIAICGSTINQSWNPPMDAQDEMSDILIATSKRTFGGVFVNGMFKMNDLNAGTAGTDMTDTWVCFGDPSVQLRTPGTPNGPSGTGPTAPIANFSGNPTTVNVGGTVNFTDTSTGIPTSWSWTFEGGTPATSTAQNPSVVYNTVGTFDVSLTAMNAQGSDGETKTDYITVNTTSGDDIAEAVDYTATFTKSGNANWAKVTDIYYNGGDSAKSGTITHSQSTTIETSVTVTAAKNVKFYWKVSSESGYDYLRFYIDGVQKNQIAGTVDWTQVTNSIAAGTHTLKWTYSKDASVSSGSDCGWVDKLEIVDGGITYCASQGNNQADEWIARVRIGTLDKSSGASPYSDYTATVTNYTRGASQSVTLTPGFSGSAYTEYWCVWIDYNKNGVFTDTGESVFSKSGSAAVTGSFTISSSASTGNTRMRVSMKYGSAPTSCETFTYGEVEDYTANIL